MKKGAQVWMYDPDDKNRRGAIAKIILSTIIAGAIAATWILSISKKPLQNDGRVMLSQLQSDFDQISPPESTIPLTNVVAEAKPQSALVEGTYMNRQSVSFILKSYQDQLVEHEWTYKGRFQAGTMWRESYCKDSLEASIANSSFPKDGTVAFTFSMAWSDISIQECGH